MSTERIDVLAVMEKAARETPRIALALKIDDARNAVAEIIEAAKDCNEWLCRTGLEGTAHQRNLLAALDRLGVSPDMRLRSDA